MASETSRQRKNQLLRKILILIDSRQYNRYPFRELNVKIAWKDFYCLRIEIFIS